MTEKRSPGHLTGSEEPQISEIKKLRWGFSTGTAATAAALGAARFLAEGRPPDQVEVKLPGLKRLTINIAEASRLSDGGIKASVIKDAGDDPDVTNGARIGVVLHRAAESGLVIVGGSGVGKVTRPGLAVEVGQWAINPVPRRMLAENLAPFTQAEGLIATVFIDNGQELAQKTLNPRLGIVGGLSVLGTTGFVKPFSNGAYLATIDSAMKVAKASGLREIVLTTGGRSELFSQAVRADLPPQAFIQIADFFRSSLKLAVHHKFETIGLGVFFGKAVKQASLVPYTHAHRSELDLSVLTSWLKGLDADILKAIASAPTALAALDILKKSGAALEAVPEVARRVIIAARSFCGQGPQLWVNIFDFDGVCLAQAGD
jgi:cobalt-precorrin-5B (C1)-methyltransferase